MIFFGCLFVFSGIKFMLKLILIFFGYWQHIYGSRCQYSRNKFVWYTVVEKSQEGLEGHHLLDFFLLLHLYVYQQTYFLGIDKMCCQFSLQLQMQLGTLTGRLLFGFFVLVDEFFDKVMRRWLMFIAL
jgi:hypothetical protein